MFGSYKWLRNSLNKKKQTNSKLSYIDSSDKIISVKSTNPLTNLTISSLKLALGCNPIVLIGMSCRYYDGKTDFYGKNPSHKPHTLRNCSRGLAWIQKCKRFGRTIINCSPSDVFEKSHTLDEVFANLGERPPQNRESLVKKLMKTK